VKANLIRFRAFAQTIANEKTTKRLENIGKGAALAIAGTTEALVFANLEKLTYFASTMFACGGVAVSILVILGLIFRQANRTARFTKEFADFVYPYSRGEPIPQEFTDEHPGASQALKTMANDPDERLSFELSTLDKIATLRKVAESMERAADKATEGFESFNRAKQMTAELTPRVEGLLEISQRLTEVTLSGTEEMQRAARDLSTTAGKLAGSAHQLTELTEAAGELEAGLLALEKSYCRTERVVSSLKELDEAGALERLAGKHNIN
jgi:hypothetical protein